MKQAAAQEPGPNHWADKTKKEEKQMFYFIFVLNQETRTHKLELSSNWCWKRISIYSEAFCIY